MNKTQQPQSTTGIDSVPSDLDSPQAKLVYLYLATTDGSTVDDISQSLAMKKISVLSLLSTLRSADHVTERDQRYVVTA